MLLGFKVWLNSILTSDFDAFSLSGSSGENVYMYSYIDIFTHGGAWIECKEEKKRAEEKRRRLKKSKLWQTVGAE